MKVIILLVFVLLLGYQVYLNLEGPEELAPVPAPVQSLKTPEVAPATPADLPPDIPASETVNNDAPPAEATPVSPEETPVTPDVASGMTEGETPPPPDPGSLMPMDVGSKMMGSPSSDKGSLNVPSSSSGGTDSGS